MEKCKHLASVCGDNFCMIDAVPDCRGWNICPGKCEKKEVT
jgi:hypothetical protein